MKLELSKIPEGKKGALTEAQANCRSEEFSDGRLEKFLRCEGMNAEVRFMRSLVVWNDYYVAHNSRGAHDFHALIMLQLAAQRFVGYWEKRKKVFGPEKYLMRLTLSEALRDDLVALEAGVFSLLPHKDLSGRQIINIVPHNHTGDGYSSESLVSEQECVHLLTLHNLTHTHVTLGLVSRNVLRRRGSSGSQYRCWLWCCGSGMGP